MAAIYDRGISKVNIHNRTKRKSYNIPGHLHFLTFSCFQRYPVFLDEFACNLLAKTIETARKEIGFEMYSYVFMPDHIHLLVKPLNEKYDISKILKSVKGAFAKKYIEFLKMKRDSRLENLKFLSSGKTSYRVWERGGGFDRNLYTIDRIIAAIEYIEDNPLRKGLVNDSSDWLWSSAKDRRMKIGGQMAVDEFKP